MKSKFFNGLLLLALILSMTACSDSGELGKTGDSSDLIVVHSGTVITATGSDPIGAGIVVIEGNQILFVGATGDYPIPSGAQEFDAGGMTILPGIIDAHVHSTSNPAVRRDFLVSGVTSVCDMGTPLREISQFELENVGEDPVARGLQAGLILTAPGGLPDAVLGGELNYEVGTPDEGRAAVEDLYRRGVSQIKVYIHEESNGITYPLLDEATMGAIVEEAHSHGLPVRAHVTYVSLLGMALSVGVDSIEHVPIHGTQAENQSVTEEQRRQLFEGSDPLQAFFDGGFPEYEGHLQEMVEAGTFMVPTLDRPFGQLLRAPSPTEEQRVYLEIILGIVGRFNQLGGNVGLGTDYNTDTGVQAGMPIGEMEMLLAAGLTLMEVIEAGTRHAAAACGHGDQLGTLESGKLADVIVVDGDPLEDLMAMNQVVLVIKNGEVAFALEEVFGSR